MTRDEVLEKLVILYKTEDIRPFIMENVLTDPNDNLKHSYYSSYEYICKNYFRMFGWTPAIGDIYNGIVKVIMADEPPKYKYTDIHDLEPYYAHFPNMKYTFLEGHDHLSPFTKPYCINRAVEDTLAEADTANSCT